MNLHTSVTCAWYVRVIVPLVLLIADNMQKAKKVGVVARCSSFIVILFVTRSHCM